LEAARWAPSAHNAQPWRFIVLSDEPSKRKLALAMAKAWTADLVREGAPPELYKKVTEFSIQRFTSAPLLVVACITMVDMTKYADEPRQRNERDLAVQSLGAAVQNMLLAAQSVGLGACWFCAPVFCKDDVRKVLRIPEDAEPQALITVGYPAEKPIAPSRKPLRDVSYFGSWGEPCRREVKPRRT
jgi:F420 biosynthesis protein FbiB-like protein